jgi:hypothetical protein
MQMSSPLVLRKRRRTGGHCRGPAPATDESAWKAICRAAVLVAAALLCGCAASGVNPWERDLMARPEMALDPAPIDSAMDDHIYFSKEASTGGRGFGGGGCGCN